MAEKRAIKQKKKLKKGKMDITFLAFILILLTIGLVMLFSASYAYSLQYYNNSYKFISKQLLLAGVGLVAMFIMSWIDYRFWRKFAWIVYGATAILSLC